MTMWFIWNLSMSWQCLLIKACCWHWADSEWPGIWASKAIKLHLIWSNCIHMQNGNVCRLLWYFYCTWSYWQDNRYAIFHAVLSFIVFQRGHSVCLCDNMFYALCFYAFMLYGMTLMEDTLSSLNNRICFHSISNVLIILLIVLIIIINQM